MTPRISPRRHPPEVWADVREAYLSGATAAECELRFGVRQGALRARARRQHWTKAEAWAAREAVLAATPAALPAPRRESLALAEMALARASEALRAGRATEATALIKAGDAVGDFAEFVALNRERDEADYRRKFASTGEDGSAPPAVDVVNDSLPWSG